MAVETQTPNSTAFLREFATRLDLPEYKNGTPSLSLGQLMEAFAMGRSTVQFTKVRYLEKLIAHRLKNGLGPNLKTQAQLVFQSESLEQGFPIGDPGTWILDPSDPTSCLAVGEYMVHAENAQELWMGTALDDDMTDILGDKDTPTPLIKGLKSSYHIHQILELLYGKISLQDVAPEILRANIDKTGKQSLEEVYNFIPKIYARKLAKRWVMAEHNISEEDFEKLLDEKQRKLVAEFEPRALATIQAVLGGEKTWEELNADLAALNQSPINPENHPLIKLFAQDKGSWKIADIIASPEGVIIEIPRTKFTHRGDSGNDTTRIEVIVEDGKPIIVCDQDDLPWLKYLSNSLPFLTALEKNCVPKLGKSPYYQVEIMFNVFKGEIAFATDGIAGIHKINQRDLDGETPLQLSDILGNQQGYKIRSKINHQKIKTLDSALTALSDLEQGDISADRLATLEALQDAAPHIFNVDMGNLRLETLYLHGEPKHKQESRQELSFVVGEILSTTIRNAYAKLKEILRITSINKPQYAPKSHLLHTIPLSVRPTQREIANLVGLLNSIRAEDFQYS